jgi:hypothetical protein
MRNIEPVAYFRDQIVPASQAKLSIYYLGIAPVTKVNGIPIADGKPGPLFHRITQRWGEQVGMDILAQIAANCS